MSVKPQVANTTLLSLCESTFWLVVSMHVSDEYELCLMLDSFVFLKEEIVLSRCSGLSFAYGEGKCLLILKRERERDIDLMECHLSMIKIIV